MLTISISNLLQQKPCLVTRKSNHSKPICGSFNQLHELYLPISRNKIIWPQPFAISPTMKPKQCKFKLSTKIILLYYLIIGLFSPGCNQHLTFDRNKIANTIWAAEYCYRLNSERQDTILDSNHVGFHSIFGENYTAIMHIDDSLRVMLYTSYSDIELSTQHQSQGYPLILNQNNPPVFSSNNYSFTLKNISSHSLICHTEPLKMNEIQNEYIINFGVYKAKTQ